VIFPFTTTVLSEDETAALAGSFSTLLNPGDIVVLNGNLGSGKTFFVKRICSEWGISNVNSPTFAIVNEYEGDRRVYHFDFYRINTLNELLDIGFTDYLNDEEAVIFIEWGNLMEEILPKNRMVIQIEILLDEQRRFNFIKINE
jgi:tRNA threonylcarbamoyladenosine biosynthesis protein TsaE